MTDNQTEGRTEEQAAKAAPLSLPAGSYDVEALLKGTSGIDGVELAKRDEVIGAAIAAADASIHKQADPSLDANFKYQDVTREDLGVTERIQVYEPPAQEAPVEEAAPPPPPPPPPPTEKGKGKNDDAGEAGKQE